MFQLGMFRTGRVVVGAAVAAIAVTTLGAASAQADAAPVLPTGAPATCVAVADTPTVGQTTITDSTLPTVTSVTWSHTSYIAKAKAVARVVVKTTDDCAGADDVAVDLHNSSTGATATFEPTGYAQSVTSTGFNQTWTFDIPLHGTDAGAISVSKVELVSAFSTADLPDGGPRHRHPVVSPNPDTTTPDDYTLVSPPKTAKTVVKAYTTLDGQRDARARQGRPLGHGQGHAEEAPDLDVRRGRLAVRDAAVPPAGLVDVALDQEGQDHQQGRRQRDVQGHQEGHVRVPRCLRGLDVRRRGHSTTDGVAVH